MTYLGVMFLGAVNFPKTIQKYVGRRLKEMEQHGFVKMDCSGDFVTVGGNTSTWTPKAIANVLPRMAELASDPARGDKITKGGMEEAAVALAAENSEVFERLERESTGKAEFTDENGREWDVKSPLSPLEDQSWKYSPEHQLSKVRRDFDQGDNVLLNLTRVNHDDLNRTVSLLHNELSCVERDKLIIFADLNLLQD